jgi:hypothetical protein
MRVSSVVPMLLAGVVLASPLAAQTGGRRPAPRPGSQPAPRPAPASPSSMPAATSGDETSVELGVDGSFTRFQDAETNQISVPSVVRVGFYLTPRISIEPAVSFDYRSGGGLSSRSLGADASLLWHLTGTRRTSQIYLRPFAGVVNTSIDLGATSNNSTDVSAGGALGIKLPLASNRVAFRVDGFYRRLFTDPGQNTFGANFGLSLYTR